MLYKILRMMVLLVLLSGCSLRSNECYREELPVFPLAGEEAAEELQELCKGKECKHIGDYLYDLYVFKLTYALYKEE